MPAEEKLGRLLAFCRAHDIHTTPVWIGSTLVVPLFAWHEAVWDREPEIPGAPSGLFSDSANCGFSVPDPEIARVMDARNEFYNPAPREKGLLCRCPQILQLERRCGRARGGRGGSVVPHPRSRTTSPLAPRTCVA